MWYMLTSGTGSQKLMSVSLGSGNSIPVPADYDGDGKTDVAVFSPQTGNWQIAASSSSSTYVVSWGLSTDVPLLGR